MGTFGLWSISFALEFIGFCQTNNTKKRHFPMTIMRARFFFLFLPFDLSSCRLANRWWTKMRKSIWKKIRNLGTKISFHLSLSLWSNYTKQFLIYKIHLLIELVSCSFFLLSQIFVCDRWRWWLYFDESQKLVSRFVWIYPLSIELGREKIEKTIVVGSINIQLLSKFDD